MKNKRILNAICLWVVVTSLIIGMALPVFASQPDKQIVRVAYFNMGTYYTEVAEGIVDSYDTEVLNQVEKYSNLSFQYINCRTWAEALQMLVENRVDLVGTVQWNPERESQYEFCLESYGYTVGELAALSSRGYIFEDYTAIGNSVVGSTGNYVRLEEIKQLFSSHGISPEMKYYETQLELETALESGEIDLIAANSHTLKEDYVAVEKFTFSPFFFISRKGNTTLTDQIDAALISINIQDPGRNDALMLKYFPSIMGAPLTKQEQDLIAQNKTYDVYLDATTKPTSWYDEKTASLQGGLVEVCRQVTEKTGLKLHPVPVFSRETQLDASCIRTTTVYTGADELLLSQPGETNALLDEAFNLYYREDQKIDLEAGGFSIAIVANRVHLRDYLCNTYLNITIKEYPTPTACLEAVSRGDADLTYLDCRIADNAITENGITRVKEFPIEPQHQGIALLFPEENRDLLVSIVNKGLEQVDQDVVSDLFLQYALDTEKPVTLATLVRDHWILTALAGLFLTVILVSFAVLLTYVRVMKKQKDRIQQADADRTEFFGRMSHDMRTPMNGILGMIELSESSDSVTEIRENLHKAKAAGQYMLSLINDTLDLQRLESKKLQLEQNIVHVADYYNDIFSIMEVSAAKKNLGFHVHYIGIDMDNYIELDAVRMKQILSNLISNAIKFTPEGGAVEITVESLGEEDTVLHRKYQVKDTGVGMSADFIQNRLFKPYSQENNQLSTQLTGSGLGMAITKNLVEIMGGRLEVESALGEGTVFTVYLDIRRASREDAEKAVREKAAQSDFMITGLNGRHILLCEDHPLNAEIARRLLEKAGCTVEWAENGKLGLERFARSEAHTFDAILMDIRMPVMDGLTAAREIRALANKDAKTIPIIAMTANAYASDIAHCMESGMNAHLAKPVDPHKLYSVLYSTIAEGI